MTFTMPSVALVFCGVLLQMGSGVVLNPSYNPNPSLADLQNQMQYQALHPAYQSLPKNQLLNPDIIQNNPLYNYKDILSNPPYAYFCDCDMSPFIDQYTVEQLNQIADQYNQRNCDIQQLYMLIDSTMPTLPDQPWRMNMIKGLANGLHDEQARRQLAYLPEYPGFCNSIYPEALPTLSKRSPVVDYQSTLLPSPSTVNAMAYYYNLYYLMDKIMPDISPQFKQDIKDAVYTNTTPPELGNASELIRRLTSNLRVTVSQMYDYIPSFY